MNGAFQNGAFHTTRWTVVLHAGSGGSPQSREALSTLCAAYWYPLYAFARRRGHGPHEAEDLTQGFFAVLLEKNYVGKADPEQGRFRSFLLTAFKRFASKERDRNRAGKRGGGRPVLPIDFEKGERRYALEPSHDVTPERIYDRRWALTLLESVLERLRREMDGAGKSDLFQALKSHLWSGGEPDGHEKTAERLGMKTGALKVALYRLRGRYRELLRAEIAQTVSTPQEVDQEIRYLMDALRA